MNTAKQKRPKAFCFGGDGVCFAWNIPSAPFYAVYFTAIGFFYALPKNSPQDCFYLALLGTVAFESRRLFSPKQKTPEGVLFWRRRWDSNPRYREVQLISSQSRYDHFDTSPYMRPISQALFNSF